MTEYLEGALSAAEADAVEAHLDWCGNCGCFVTQLQITVAALRDLAL